MAHITIAVEGIGDAAIATRLCKYTGHQIAGAPYIANGKRNLDRRIFNYNRAAVHTPWLVLRDLDFDAPCAVELCGRLLPAPSAGMLLRVAVRMAESWLLADRTGIAAYLKVPIARLPIAPEELDRAKRTMVDAARHSATRVIREEMVPEDGISAEVGPGYTTRLIDFATNHWSPDAAAASSESLRRCINALLAI